MTVRRQAPSEQDAWLQDAYDDHGRELHAHCYRLAGNVADANDPM